MLREELKNMEYLEVEKKLNYKFKNKDLLQEALIHSSYKNENRDYKGVDNERLEFFGDSILNFVISEYLFTQLKHKPEGFLSKVRSNIVCEGTLASVASKLNFGEHLKFGKGEIVTGGKYRPSILADSIEAIIGAIYLDSNIEVVRKIILELLRDQIEKFIKGDIISDYKTVLQEQLQKDGNVEIKYVVVEEYGPAHDKNFIVEIFADGKALGKGTGKTKKESEQNAAKKALGYDGD